MMIDEIVKELDENLSVIKTEKINGILYLYCEIKHTPIECKYCGEVSNKIHSRYLRTISDLPIQNYQVKLIITVPKYFCGNKECSHKTFAYPILFAGNNSLRTERLDWIYVNSLDTKTQNIILLF